MTSSVCYYSTVQSAQASAHKHEQYKFKKKQMSNERRQIIIGDYRRLATRVQTTKFINRRLRTRAVLWRSLMAIIHLRLVLELGLGSPKVKTKPNYYALFVHYIMPGVLVVCSRLYLSII